MRPRALSSAKVSSPTSSGANVSKDGHSENASWETVEKSTCGTFTTATAEMFFMTSGSCTTMDDLALCFPDLSSSTLRNRGSLLTAFSPACIKFAVSLFLDSGSVRVRRPLRLTVQRGKDDEGPRSEVSGAATSPDELPMTMPLRRGGSVKVRLKFRLFEGVASDTSDGTGETSRSSPSATAPRSRLDVRIASKVTDAFSREL
mmetsp:Transcript_31579/g.84375  ORF Transcript_31579/g.84375 Transcript_31579/m.84375 type:complete len:203 (+) Transcript_31579:2354-2962(+)